MMLVFAQGTEAVVTATSGAAELAAVRGGGPVSVVKRNFARDTELS
jgi:hypothetical protein